MVQERRSQQSLRLRGLPGVRESVRELKSRRCLVAKPIKEQVEDATAKLEIEPETLVPEVEIDVPEVEALTEEASSEEEQDGEGIFDKIGDFIEDVVETVADAAVDLIADKISKKASGSLAERAVDNRFGTRR